MPTLRIRYEGEFDYQGVYDLISKFFRKRNYDFFETKLKEKDATPAGREILIVFKPEKKVTEYIKYTYKVEWKCVDAHSTSEELMHARMYLTVTPDVEMDWQKYGKKHSKISKLYQKYVIKKEVDEVHQEEAGIEAQTLIDEINEFIGMEV